MPTDSGERCVIIYESGVVVQAVPPITIYSHGEVVEILPVISSQQVGEVAWVEVATNE